MKRVFCLLLALVLLTGCGQRKNIEIDHNQVTVSISTEPETLDPCLGWGHGTTPLVQSTLVEYKQDMTFANDLATDYRLSEDRLVWTFDIRNDVKFTDGEALTAEDVAKITDIAISETGLDASGIKIMAAN